jgi:hypothetical protein
VGGAAPRAAGYVQQKAFLSKDGVRPGRDHAKISGKDLRQRSGAKIWGKDLRQRSGGKDLRQRAEDLRSRVSTIEYRTSNYG